MDLNAYKDSNKSCFARIINKEYKKCSMKIIKRLLFLSLFAMIFTNTAHSQEKEVIYEPMEPMIEVVTEDPPIQVKREVITAVDAMVDMIPDAAPAVVKKAPVYPGCSGENYEELKQCTRSKILEHIGSNFNYDVAVLMNEVIRVLESLPKMEAGEQDGEKVNVSFMIPIVFDLED